MPFGIIVSLKQYIDDSNIEYKREMVGIFLLDLF